MSSSNSNPNQIPKEVPDVIGIKFGSRNTVLGIVKNHAVDTLTLSNREIASMVSFTKNNRTFEDSAQISFLKNISSTYINLNRLIGLKYESNEFLEHEKKFMFFDYEYNNDIKEYLYECQYKQKLPIENIIASFFTHLNKAIINRDNKKQINGMVVSIPDYFNLYQRNDFRNMAKTKRKHSASPDVLCFLRFFAQKELPRYSITNYNLHIDPGSGTVLLPPDILRSVSGQTAFHAHLSAH